MRHPFSLTGRRRAGIAQPRTPATRRYGGWVKDKTEVLDRVLLVKSEFWRWTWVWEPRLGGIELGEKPGTASYELPGRLEPRTARGWFPN